jgi:hypothetical protein
MGKATARANMLTLVINQRPSLNRDRNTEFISERIGGPIVIYNVDDVKDERA